MQAKRKRVSGGLQQPLSDVWAHRHRVRARVEATKALRQDAAEHDRRPAAQPLAHDPLDRAQDALHLLLQHEQLHVPLQCMREGQLVQDACARVA